MAKSIIEKKTLDHQLGDELISINAVEKEFDDIASLAAIICQMPISLITLVDNDNIYFKSRFGLNAEKFSTEYSFCKQALANPHEILVVEDARLDKRFKNNPFTIGEPHVVFYAGIPMILPSGAIIGVLSVLDHIPRILTNDQIKALKIFSNQIEKLFELSQNQLKIKHTESQLIKETERLSNIIRATHVGTWEWNVQTGKVEYNERWAEMIGYTLEELAPIDITTWQKLIHPEDFELSEQKAHDCFTKKSDYYDVEYRMMHKDGSVIWVNDFGRVIEWTAEGKPLFMLGAHTDITAKVMDRERIKKSEARFRVLVENGADAIAIIGTDGFATYVSPSITGVLGYTEEEALKLNLFELVHPDDIAAVSAKMEEVLNNPSIPIFGHNSRTKHKDGSWRYLEATITNLLDDPSINGIVYNFRDVTERVLKEQKLKSSEQKFSYVTSITKIGYWKLEIDQQILTWSDEVYRIWGRAKEDFEVSIENLIKTIHPDDQESFLQKQKLSIIEEMDHDFVYRIILPDGQIKWVRELGLLLKDENGKSVVFDGAVQDITKQKTEEQQIKMLQEIITMTSDTILITEAEPLSQPGPRILYVNEAFTALTGYLPSEVIGKTPRMLQGPATNKNELRKLGRAIRELESCEVTVVNYRKNGEKFWNNITVNPVADASGKYTHWVAIEKDVTPQKNKEIEKDIKNKISIIFRQNNDLEECLTKLSEHLVKFGGFDFVEIWLPAADSKTINRVTRYSESPAGSFFYTSSKSLKSFKMGQGLPGYIWKNGKVEVWEKNDAKGSYKRILATKKVGINALMGIPLKHDKEIIGVLLLGTSKTKAAFAFYSELLQKLAPFIGPELNRKKLEVELARVFDFSPDMICMTGFDGYIKKINKSGLKLLGYSLEEMLASPIESFVHKKDRTISKEKQIELYEVGKINDFENRYITKEGKTIWLSWTATAMPEHGIVYSVAKDITYRKVLVDLLDTAASLARVGSWEMDLMNQSVYWSPLVYEIHQLEESFRPEMNRPFAFFDGDYQNIFQALLEECLVTGKSLDFAAPINTANGEQYWTRIRGQVECIDRKCVRIYGSFQDIDEKIKNEKQLEKSYSEKNKILESLGDGFFTVDKNWIVTYWNKRAEIILGRSRESILGENLWEQYEDAIDSEFYRQYHRAMANNIKVNFEEYYPTLQIWFEIMAYPTEDGLSVFLKDVTQRKEKDIEIQKAKERFERVTQATADAIWDWDIESETFFRSSGYKELLGYNFKKLSNQKEFWNECFHCDDLAMIKNRVTEALGNPKTSKWRQEYRVIHKDGTIKTVSDRAVIIRDQNGKAIRMVGAVTDISYRKEHEKELLSLNESLKEYTHNLEISNEQLEQFAFIASHDLQEPLRMITSFLSQLERKFNDKLDHKAREYIQFATDGAKRMRQIVLNLLEYSIAGNLNESIELVDMGEIFTDYTTLRRKLISEKSVKITAPNLPVVNAFKAPLVQTVHCLLDNAIKYSRKGVSPKVEFIIEERGEDWLFTIKDNGIGIDEVFFEKIFVIFQRLHNRDEYEGTGIGLSIAKKNVESWGGKIWVESFNEQGSTFHFTLSKEPFFKKEKSVV